MQSLMTPAQLIEELAQRGFDVTERRLTDWRQKGLLPLLVHRGLGRGHGSEYFWSDPEIVHQALMVCVLLKRKRRTQLALSRLWLAGYAVPLDRIKRAWGFDLKDNERFLRRRASRLSGVDFEGYLARFAANAADESFVRDLTNSDVAEGIADLGATLTYDEAFHPEPDDISVLLDQFLSSIGFEIGDDDYPVLEHAAKASTNFAKSMFPVHAMKEEINSATIDNLNNTRNCLRNLRLIIQVYYVMRSRNLIELLYYTQSAARVFAPSLATLHIHMQRAGIHQDLDWLMIKLARTLLNELARAPSGNFQVSVLRILNLGYEILISTWPDFDPEEFWVRLSAKT